jgi:hypothetical protein
MRPSSGITATSVFSFIGRVHSPRPRARRSGPGSWECTVRTTVSGRGALHIVVLGLAATSSVKTTAQAMPPARRRVASTAVGTPGGCLARRSKLRRAPRDRGATTARSDSPRAVQATAAGAPRRRPLPQRHLANASTLRADRMTTPAVPSCLATSAARAMTTARGTCSEPAQPLPSRLRRPDNVQGSAAAARRRGNVCCSRLLYATRACAIA